MQNFSIHFWKKYMSLFVSLAAIVVPIVSIEKVPAVSYYIIFTYATLLLPKL